MADHLAHPDPLAACPNCAFALAAVTVEAPRFCPRCGQETVLHPPSATEFVHEFVGHYVALEGALWRTLRLLVLRPGRLTREYLAGRRQRYVLPLRLYLSASFLFFLVAKLAPAQEEFVLVRVDGTTPRIVAATSASAASAALPALSEAPAMPSLPPLCGTGRAGVCSWLDHRMQASRHELETDPQRASDEFRGHFLSHAPYALFLLLPFFAGVLALAYRGRRMRFGEHLVFCMHLMAFWFLLAAVATVLPAAGLLLFILGVAYAVQALHVVHGGRWRWTFARATVVGFVYAVLLLLATTLMTLAVVLA